MPAHRPRQCYLAIVFTSLNIVLQCDMSRKTVQWQVVKKGLDDKAKANFSIMHNMFVFSTIFRRKSAVFLWHNSLIFLILHHNSILKNKTNRRKEKRAFFDAIF